MSAQARAGTEAPGEALGAPGPAAQEAACVTPAAAQRKRKRPWDGGGGCAAVATQTEPPEGAERAGLDQDPVAEVDPAGGPDAGGRDVREMRPGPEPKRRRVEDPRMDDAVLYGLTYFGEKFLKVIAAVAEKQEARAQASDAQHAALLQAGRSTEDLVRELLERHETREGITDARFDYLLAQNRRLQQKLDELLRRQRPSPRGSYSPPLSPHAEGSYGDPLQLGTTPSPTPMANPGRRLGGDPALRDNLVRFGPSEAMDTRAVRFASSEAMGTRAVRFVSSEAMETPRARPREL